MVKNPRVNNQIQLWRALAIIQLGGKCCKCNSIEELHIHHKNGDWTDSRMENLELLCRTCHRERHSKKGIVETRKCLRVFSSTKHKLEKVQLKMVEVDNCFYGDDIVIEKLIECWVEHH